MVVWPVHTDEQSGIRERKAYAIVISMDRLGRSLVDKYLVYQGVNHSLSSVLAEDLPRAQVHHNG